MDQGVLQKSAEILAPSLKRLEKQVSNKKHAYVILSFPHSHPLQSLVFTLHPDRFHVGLSCLHIFSS